jgi:NDP-hexose C3-ketoreductase / dTDP-4-oxo-2-deoxy-alpha-D-pentos-2-ene 2,3-reductase
MTLRPGPYEHLRTAETFAALDRFRAAAVERNVSMATLAVAWALGHPCVTSVVIGPRTVEQLEEALAALTVELSEDERDELGALLAR